MRGSEEGSVTGLRAARRGASSTSRDVPKDGATVLPADATQRQCIDAATRGHSFVMDGPPGTGKSQTIANMIAENIALGPNGLVRQREGGSARGRREAAPQVGLGDYTLELHSHKATRKEVAQELARALTHHPQARAEHARRGLVDARRDVRELSQRAAAVNEIREPLGRSLTPCSAGSPNSKTAPPAASPKPWARCDACQPSVR